MRIYLDACCVNRPFDDQAQDRVRLESEAVLIVLSRFENGDWWWVGSDALVLETSRNPDADRRARVQLLLSSVDESVALGVEVVARGRTLEAIGFGAYDALHLASAEAAGVDVLLTTDDGLLRRARRHPDELHVRVANPLAWLSESL